MDDEIETLDGQTIDVSGVPGGVILSVTEPNGETRAFIMSPEIALDLVRQLRAFAPPPSPGEEKP